MARCDQGYLCRVCGQEVAQITDSELYLRFVIGEIDPELLHLHPDCHLRCSPAVSQFIDDSRFGARVAEAGLFSQEHLDPEYVAQRTDQIRRGYARLWEIQKSKEISTPIHEYPLPEYVSHWQ